MATWVPWTSISALSGRTINCFAGKTLSGIGISNSVVIAGTDVGIFYNDTSNPFSWGPDGSSGISGSNIVGVACTSGNEVMFAVTSNKIYYSTSGGGNIWTEISISNLTLTGSISCVACSINSGTVKVVFGVNGGNTYNTRNTTSGNYSAWNAFSPSSAFSSNSNIALCTSIACNYLGTYWVLTVSDGAGSPVGASPGIYQCTDGTGWGTVIGGTGGQTYTSVMCCNGNDKFVACSQGNGLNTTQGAIFISDAGGATGWANLSAPQLSYLYIRPDANGTKLYACAGTNGLYYSLNSGTTWTNDTTTPPSPATTVAAVYVNPTVTNTGLPLYIGSSTRGFYAGYNPSTPICFKEGSKILCLVDGKESYIPVETMRPGTLVKTVYSGYKKVEHIGHSKVYNPAHTLRSKNRLYVCTKTNYPEVTEDLVLTGCHSILVGSLSTKERADVIDITGDTYVTDGHYRLVACADERAVPYTQEGLHTIWHFALEHDDYYMNYGVYANGLLVETTSKRMMKELSGMELM